MNERLREFIEKRNGEIDSIPADRQKLINDLADYNAGKIMKGSRPKLIFICTHNSRRSIMGQLWALVAAEYYGIKIEGHSGGTEATAFYPSALEAMERAGLTFIRLTEPPNPIYEFHSGDDMPAIRVFSKKYDDLTNPASGFAAIMTCSDADEACPFIPGADIRVPLRYEDPKIFDGTPEEVAAYDERCAQIAREMALLFKSVKEILGTQLV
jgi:protein-tyrosine-phosphatase